MERSLTILKRKIGSKELLLIRGLIESAGHRGRTYKAEIRKSGAYTCQADQPLFPFSYGLSYTQFQYSNLRIEPSTANADGKIIVQAKDLSFYVIAAQKFVVEPGQFDVMVGSSSADVRLNGDFQIR